MMQKEFPTLGVVSAASGYLLTEIGVVYQVLSFASGESVFTHQLPRVGREFKAALLADQPEIAEIFEYIERETTPETYRDVASEVKRRIGATMTVRRMTADQHERIDPMSELAEKVHPDRIITVTTGAPND
jgi:hypothetical protein